MRIVGVHGVGRYRPGIAAGLAAERLGVAWAGYLAGAGLPIDLRMAYYAGFLHATAQATGDGLDDLTAAGRDMFDAWAGHLGAHSDDLAQASWSIPARIVVDRIARQRQLDPVPLRRLIGVFLREATAYLRAPDAPCRLAARQEVARTIDEHRPAIVIAHSFGSVVAYEALLAYPAVHTDLLITVGSPLGMTGVVFERLVPAPVAGLGIRPPNVRRWINIADPGDIVTVPRPFTRRFQPDHNHDDQHIHWLDFHSARRYLSAAPTLSSLRSYAADTRPDRESA
jgi:hypothetical protein